ncbi:hypothetical protein FKM82_026357 [Ascaphus truei]
MTSGAPGQAVWKKTFTSSPQSVLWNRTQHTGEDRLLHPTVSEAKSSSSSSSNHSDNFLLRAGSSPLEVPQRRWESNSYLALQFGFLPIELGCVDGSERIRTKIGLAAFPSFACYTFCSFYCPRSH